MSRRPAFIVILPVVIGVFATPTWTFARVVHCGSVSLQVPDVWKARDAELKEDASRPAATDGVEELLGTWEAFTGEESHGYLTVGVSKRFALITPARARHSRRELETHLGALPCIERARVIDFDTVQIDGAPAYRARYILETRDGEIIDQRLYIVGGRETSFFSFTRAAGHAPDDDSQFDAIMRRARIREHPVFPYAVTRELSLGFLSVLAGSSLLVQRLLARRPRRKEMKRRARRGAEDRREEKRESS